MLIALDTVLSLRNLQCSFGARVVPSSFEHTALVACVAPPAVAVESVHVLLTTDAGTIRVTESFGYEHEPEVQPFIHCLLPVHAYPPM